MSSVSPLLFFGCVLCVSLVEAGDDFHRSDDDDFDDFDDDDEKKKDATFLLFPH